MSRTAPGEYPPATGAELPGSGLLLRASGVAERLAGRPVDPATVAWAQGQERLARWRQREPFATGQWWSERLAQQHLDEATLAAMLGESDAGLAARLGEPEWCGRLRSDLAYGARDLANGARDLAYRAGVEVEGTHFLAVVAPLIAAARDRLVAELGPVVARATTPLGVTGQTLVDQLVPPLAERVDRILQRTMALELHTARRDGRLRGDTSHDRFADFVAGLATSVGRRELLERYPVLARRLAVAIANWEHSGRLLVSRLVTDLPCFMAEFGDGADPGPVTAVQPGLGDSHRGGLSVASVRWAGGLRAIYKPRPVSVDVHFQALLRWVNTYVEHPFRTLRYLDRGDYGWVEFVEAQSCSDAAAIRRFYHREGGLLALLHALSANDFHAENLIAAGEQPVLVDLESLLAPGLPVADDMITEAERTVLDATTASVLGVGLLPGRMWAVNAENTGTDISGMGGAPGVATPLAVPAVTDPGADTMRIELAVREMNPTEHRPVAADAPLHLLDYADDVLAGFTEIYHLLWRYRDELTAEGGPIDAFKGDVVRALFRPTLWYGVVSHAGNHPDVLRDGLDAERHLDILWRAVPDSPWLASCIPAERRDLGQGDIPLFTTRTDATDVFDSRGEVVPGISVRPGMAQVADRLAALSEGDLARQRWLIRGSLTTTALGSATRHELPSYEYTPVPEPLTRERMIQVADVIAYRLARIAFEADDSAQWMGITNRASVAWSVGPLQPDLYHGLLGVALFLGWCGQLTAERGRTTLARKALATAWSQLDRGMLDRTVGMSGLPGAIYGLIQLGRLWSDEGLIVRAESLLGRIGEAVEDDDNYDVVTGAAGTILALRTLYRARSSEAASEVIRRSAEHLRRTARFFPSGAGWLPAQLARTQQADLPIAGFAHGVGAIGWALFEAADVLDDERYRELAEAAVRYEQNLFDPDLGVWADLRHYAALGLPEGTPPPVAWCYGAMGIGIARVRTLRFLPTDTACQNEVESALHLTRQAGFGNSHCLCHGDIGNCELFLQADEALTQPQWRAEAALKLAGVVNAARTGGWICGTPMGVETPSLMVGLAGMGYGLLRAAAPERVPAVLALQDQPG